MRPKITARESHPISRKNIDPCALKVLYRLYRSGHTAYLVGGGVRDLILKRSPKDFDIVTSARPSQVKKLFRNCRLIGRRFRLAHIHFSGSKLVEVATFRSDPGAPDDHDDLLVRDDNTFGSPEEDALRRDFTINGLFYDISDFSVIDYVGGVEDISRGIVRTIRDPWIRFQEDPIRMIRAVKFAGRLGFRIEPKTWKALVESRYAIEKSPQPRIHEEIARLLEEGAAARSIRLLDESGLLECLEPNLEAYLRIAERGEVEGDPEGELVYRLLDEADEMFARGRRLSRAVLFAAWTYPMLLEEGLMECDNPDALVRDGVTRLLHRMGLSRKDTERVQQILLAQRRMRPRGKRRRSAPKSFHRKSYFGESLALFEMWVKATGEAEDELEEWRARAGETGGRSRDSDRDDDDSDSDSDLDESPPRPRRRRKVRRRRTSSGKGKSR